jgi:hypothetical protein
MPPFTARIASELQRRSVPPSSAVPARLLPRAASRACTPQGFRHPVACGPVGRGLGFIRFSWGVLREPSRPSHSFGSLNWHEVGGQRRVGCRKFASLLFTRLLVHTCPSSATRNVRAFGDIRRAHWRYSSLFPTRLATRWASAAGCRPVASRPVEDDYLEVVRS